MLRSSELRRGIASTLLLAGTLASCATPSPPRQGSAGWFVARATNPWLPTYNPKTDWNFEYAAQGDRRQ